MQTSRSSHLTVEQAAQLVNCSPRTIHEHARRAQIPHRRMGGTRRLLFLEAELHAWVDGAELEHVATANGGRVVRVKEAGA
jgi:excisionase family DNA binding protein